MKILDSGERREFSSGAVRDISEHKGRMDLLPLDIVCELEDYWNSNNDGCMSDSELDFRNVFYPISKFIETGDRSYILETLRWFIYKRYYGNLSTALLELSIHYQEGAMKYCERNWEKGIDCHCYLDSALRHYTKLLRGDKDEPHDRAFMWNLFGLLWTLNNKPDFNDLPFAHKLS